MNATPAPSAVQSDVPEHVPADLVRTLDLYEGPGMRVDPFTTMAKLHDGPRIFWTDYSRRYRHGSWVVTRAEDIRFVLNTPRLFSSVGWSQNQAITGAQWPLVPIELDGDYHRKFRALIMPWFTGPPIARLAGSIRERASSLIAAFAERGECDFVEGFGRPFPVSIFLELLGLPREEMPMLLQWEYELLHNMDPPGRVRAATAIIEYLQAAADHRRAHPRDDLITRIVQAEIGGRVLSEDEVIGLLFTLFLAGLDTVAASLSFHFHHLAIDTELQRQLRSDPALIPAAVEEFLRVFTPVNSRRRATEDIEIAGVTIKAGDWVTIPYALGSLDPLEFENPGQVNLSRKNKRHFAFAFGPHFCAGAQLARLELVIAIEEWTRRLPPFRLQEGRQIRVHGGGVYGIDHLPLTWGA